MKVRCARKDLYEGVQAAARVVSSRSSLPILSHIIIRTDNDKIQILSTDLEICLECVVEATILEEGAVTAPAKIIAEILATFPDADLTLESDENDSAKLTCGTSDFSLLGLPPDEFPQLPEVNEEVGFTISRDVLREGIRKTAFAMSQDESRAILTGILLEIREDTLRLVSTDTHRLCIYDCPLINSHGSVNIIVPSRAMNELLKAIPAGDSPIVASVSATQIVFKLDNITLYSRLIEGQFPNYHKVIPTDHTKKLIIPTDYFMQGVKRAEIIARDNNHKTLVSTDRGRLVISTESGKVGSAHEEVEVIKEGDEVKMAFNARYLIDVLSVIDSEAIELELSGDVSPAMLIPQGEESYRYILMPMQIE